MFRKEEARKQTVDPEQALSRQRDTVTIESADKPVRDKGGERRCEPRSYIDSVFVLKVRRLDRAEFQLEHELPDE